jgi:hypothetical protein
VRGTDDEGNEIWLQGNPTPLGDLASSPQQMSAEEFRKLVEASLF